VSYRWSLALTYAESHVLRPSPYFRDEYLTANERTVLLADGCLHTRDGFPEKRQARVLGEELHYNADFQPFKLWSLDGVLDGDPPAPRSSSSGSAKSTTSSTSSSGAASAAASVFPAEYDLAGYVRYMRASRETADALQEVARRAREWQRTYLLVKGYVSHAVAKVRSLVDQLVPVVAAANRAAAKLAADARTASAFVLMVDRCACEREGGLGNKRTCMCPAVARCLGARADVAGGPGPGSAWCTMRCTSIYSARSVVSTRRRTGGWRRRWPACRVPRSLFLPWACAPTYGPPSAISTRPSSFWRPSTSRSAPAHTRGPGTLPRSPWCWRGRGGWMA
jgi:hypothetical protein